MGNINMRGISPAILALALAVGAGPALAQKSKIICWKDSSGKTVGCGDTVPPEYQTSATKELNKQGVTRRTTESSKPPEIDPAKQKEKELKEQEEERHLAEKKRQDNALIYTFADEKEIDRKRDREIQTLELQLNQLKVSHKNATDRQTETNARSDTFEKNKKPVPENLKAEKTQNAADINKLQLRIAAKEKEMEELRVRYAEYRKRYSELKGTPQPASPATAPAPKK